MRKLMMAAAAAAMIAGAANANEVVYNLEASVAGVCGAYNANPNPISVNFGDLSTKPIAETVQVSAGSVTYRCNSATGFDRTIESANSGVLVRTGSSGGAGNQISYTFQHGGGSGLGFAAQSLTAPIVKNFNGSTAFLNGQTGGATFRVNGVQTVGDNNSLGTTVFAGDYTDTVTISVVGL